LQEKSELGAVMNVFNSLSLAKQFFLAGGLVTLIAMFSVGVFVTDLISQAVTQNTAAATALYVDSVIAPILPDLTTTEVVDETIEQVLDETLGQGALATRLISFRLWRRDGTAIYSNDKALMGMKVPPDEDLQRAFSGQMVSEFELDNDENAAPLFHTSRSWRSTTRSISHGQARWSPLLSFMSAPANLTAALPSPEPKAGSLLSWSRRRSFWFCR
jgi:hypothetical protein